MSDEVPHRLKIARTDDGAGVNLWSNDRTLYFSRAMWNELLCMAAEMHRTQAQYMMNFDEEVPTRAPVEAPRKYSIGDLA